MSNDNFKWKLMILFAQIVVAILISVKLIGCYIIKKQNVKDITLQTTEACDNCFCHEFNSLDFCYINYLKQMLLKSPCQRSIQRVFYSVGIQAFNDFGFISAFLFPFRIVVLPIFCK